MSLNDYFTPVSLERPDEQILLNPDLFCRHITIHTPDNPISNISDYKIAILGVPECRASQVLGIELTPDMVRNILYQLRYIEKKPKIIDLGNLKLGKEPSDTYFGLRDVILELLSHNILPVIIGGSQDLTYGLFLAFEYLKQQYTLTTIDCRLDIAFETYGKITFKNYLNSIIFENKFLFEYLNLGQQACYSLSENNDLLESLFYENIRLGLLRNQIASTEPYLRDSSILSVDFASVKHADAPGQAFASPNGFNAEDICQMARFAGFGENLKTFGLFDINPENDQNQVTINLAAQVIWYLLDGYAIRVNESPSKNPEEFKKVIVTYDDTNKLIFYKSLITQRWWCEVPSKKAQSLIIACSEEDYINASKSEIPDRWLKILKKLN